MGNRTAKTSNDARTEYTTDLSTGYSQVLKSTTGSDSVYYTRGFELISRQEGSDAFYYIYDGGLSVRVLTDESGSVTDTLVFDAYGCETKKTGTTDNSYGFQGEEKDETGLYYLRARYMDPATGTFTSMDTYGGSLSDPMSLHKYMFANANPVKYSDPSGHMSSLAETVVTIGIMATLGAEMSGVLYIFNLEDNGIYLSNDDFFSGLFDAMLNGAFMGELFGILTVILFVVVGAIVASLILGGFGLASSAIVILNGILDYRIGYKRTGVTEIIFGIIGVILSGSSIYKGIKGLSASSSAGGQSGSGNKHKTVNEILQNKTLTNQTRKVDNYTSSTKGQQAAMNDFNALNPSNVTQYSNGTTVGYLSDGNTVNLHASSSLSGTPSLEIYNPTTNTSIKIRY